MKVHFLQRCVKSLCVMGVAWDKKKVYPWAQFCTFKNRGLNEAGMFCDSPVLQQFWSFYLSCTKGRKNLVALCINCRRSWTDPGNSWRGSGTEIGFQASVFLPCKNSNGISLHFRSVLGCAFLNAFNEGSLSKDSESHEVIKKHQACFRELLQRTWSCWFCKLQTSTSQQVDQYKTGLIMHNQDLYGSNILKWRTIPVRTVLLTVLYFFGIFSLWNLAGFLWKIIKNGFFGEKIMVTVMSCW